MLSLANHAACVIAGQFTPPPSPHMSAMDTSFVTHKTNPYNSNEDDDDDDDDDMFKTEIGRFLLQQPRANMIHQDPAAALQLVHKVMNATDNHLYSTGSYDYQQATPHQNHPSKHTITTKQTHKATAPLYKNDTLQLLFSTTHYENTLNYVDEFPLYKEPTYITKKRDKNHAHDKRRKNMSYVQVL